MRLRAQMPELVGATHWINGDTTKDNLVGNPTLIHFWSVSCYMCKDMMSEVNRLRDKYMQELNIVAVHIPRTIADQDVDLVRLNAFEHHIKHPIYVDNALRMKYAFANSQVPAYYLFDKEGELRHFQAGKSGMKILEHRVNRLLNE